MLSLGGGTGSDRSFHRCHTPDPCPVDTHLVICRHRMHCCSHTLHLPNIECCHKDCNLRWEEEYADKNSVFAKYRIAGNFYWVQIFAKSVNKQWQATVKNPPTSWQKLGIHQMSRRYLYVNLIPSPSHHPFYWSLAVFKKVFFILNQNWFVFRFTNVQNSTKKSLKLILSMGDLSPPLST